MADFKDGVAVKDITSHIEWIQAGRIWLCEYGNRIQPCNGVHDPISARVLIIRDDDFNSIVLVGVDVCAFDPGMTQSIRFQHKHDGGLAFAWYGHRAPVTDEVDNIFINGHIALLNSG